MATTKATSSYLNQAPRTVAEVEAEMGLRPQATQIPAGFVEVSRERFFALLKEAAALDPMPHHGQPYHTTWEAQRGPRVTWGWSTPGWRSPSGTAYRYAVRSGKE